MARSRRFSSVIASKRSSFTRAARSSSLSFAFSVRRASRSVKLPVSQSQAWKGISTTEYSGVIAVCSQERVCSM